MLKTARNPLLICTTDRASYKRLITVGKALSDVQKRPLNVLSVQPKALVSPGTAESIQILHNIALGVGADVTVLFSDAPVLSFAVHAKQIDASEVVVDEREMNENTSLYALRDLLADIPLTVLENSGQFHTVPPLYEKHTVP